MNNLLFIDNRVNDINTVISSLTINTNYIVIDHENDNMITITNKIKNLNMLTISNIGIFQENYSLSTYSFLKSFGESKLTNIQQSDYNLDTWKSFKDLLFLLKNTYGMVHLDLMGCSIHINPDWNYVIEKLEKELSIIIRSSNDNTGNNYLGGNWILESNNVDLINLYFTENIKNYKFILGNVGLPGGCILKDGRVAMVGLPPPLGDGTQNISNELVYVVDLSNNPITNAIQLQMGGVSPAFVAILLDNGRVMTFGSPFSTYVLGRTNAEDNINNAYRADFVRDMSNNIVTDIIEISAGGGHTVMLKNDGTVMGFGWGQQGALGYSVTYNQRAIGLATYIVDSSNNKITNVSSISCGEKHTLFLMNDGTVRGIGWPYYGVLGSGHNGTSPFYRVDTLEYAIDSSNNIIQNAIGITTSSASSYILLSSSEVMSSGLNDCGQLGNGTYVSTNKFNYMIDKNNNRVKNIVSVKAGDYYGGHVMLLKRDGTVMSCGINVDGRLGYGTVNQNQNTLDYVLDSSNSPINDIKQISCGAGYTYLMKNNDDVYSFGLNSNMALALGISPYSPKPLNVTLLNNTLTNNVKNIVCHTSKTYFLMNDDKVMVTSNYLPTYVVDNITNLPITDVSMIANTMDYYTAFLLKNGRCVYNNIYTNKVIYLKDSNNNYIENIIKISCGGRHMLLLMNDGRVMALGDNDLRQLGINENIDGSNYPKYVVDSSNNQITNVIDIACGYYHNLLLLNNGTVMSSGYNPEGRLGDNTRINKSYFVNVVDSNNVPIQNVKKVAASFASSFMLLTTGEVMACGTMNWNVLSTNTGDTTVPLYVLYKNGQRITNVVDITCGYDHSVIALLDNKRAIAWGTGSYGSLGNSDIYQQAQRPTFLNDSNGLPIENIKSIHASHNITALILENNSILMYGSTAFFGIGNYQMSLIPKLTIYKNVYSLADNKSYNIISNKETTIFSSKFFIQDQIYEPNKTFTLTSPNSNSNGLFSYSTKSDKIRIDGNIVTILGATGDENITITATQMETSNYISKSINAVFKIQKATPTLSNFTILAKTFLRDNSFILIPPNSNIDGSFNYSYSTTSDKIRIDENIVTILGATGDENITITATQMETSNYASNSINAVFKIQKATTTLSNFTILDKTVLLDTSFTLIPPKSNSNGLFSYSTTSDKISINNDIVTILGSTGDENITITATQIETSDYTSNSINAVFKIQKATPTLKNFNISNKFVFTDNSFILIPPNSNSNGLISYSTTSNKISIDNDIVTILDFTLNESIMITATQMETNDFTAKSIDASFIIIKQTPTLSNFTILAKTFLRDNSFILIPPDSNSDGLFSYSTTSDKIRIDNDKVFILQETFNDEKITITCTQAETNKYYSISNSTSFSIKRAIADVTMFNSNNMVKIKNNTIYFYKAVMPNYYASRNGEWITNNIFTEKNETSNAVTCYIFNDNNLVTIITNGSLFKEDYDLTEQTIRSLPEFTNGRGGKTTIWSGTLQFKLTPTITNFLNNNKQNINDTSIIRNITDRSFILNSPNSNSSGTFNYSVNNTKYAKIISFSRVNLLAYNEGIDNNLSIFAIQQSTPDYLRGIIDVKLIIKKAIPRISNFVISDVSYAKHGIFTIKPPISSSKGLFKYSFSDETVAKIKTNTTNIVEILRATRNNEFVTVIANQEATSTFGDAKIQTTFKINKSSPNLKNFNVPNLKYEEMFDIITPQTDNPLVSFSYDTVDKEYIDISYNDYTQKYTIKILGVKESGPITISATQIETENFKSETITTTFNTIKQTPILSKFEISDITYAYDDFFVITPPKSNNEQGMFVYESLFNDFIKIIDNKVYILSATGINNYISINVKQLESQNFKESKPITAYFRIFKAYPSLTNFVISNKTYLSDISFQLIKPNSDSSGLFTYSSLYTAYININQDIVNILLPTGNLKTVQITAKQEETNNYYGSSITTEFSINKPVPIFSSFDPIIKNSTDEDFYLNLTSSNDSIPIIYSSSDTSVIQIVDSKIKILKASDTPITITATQNETLYYCGKSITTTLQINRQETILTNLVQNNNKKGNESLNIERVYKPDYPLFLLNVPTSNRYDINNGYFTLVSSNSNDGLTQSVNVNNKEVTILNAGSSLMQFDISENIHYQSANVRANLVILKDTPTLVYSKESIIATYGDNDFTAPLVISNSDGLISFKSLDPNYFDIYFDSYKNKNMIHINAAKNDLKLEICQKETNNYNEYRHIIPVNINKGNPNLSFTQSSKIIKKYLDPSFEMPTVFSLSDAPITFDISGNKSIADIENNRIVIKKSGTVDIIATQQENNNYNSSIISCKLTIEKLDTVLSNFDDIFVVPTESSYILSNPNSNRLENESSIFTFDISGSKQIIDINGTYVNIKGVGSVDIVATQLESENYKEQKIICKFVISKIETVISNFNIDSKIFLTDISFTLVDPYSNRYDNIYENIFVYDISGNSSVAELIGNKVIIKSPGTVDIIATQLANEIYTESNKLVTTLVVEKALTTFTNYIETITKRTKDPSFTLINPSTNRPPDELGIFSYKIVTPGIAQIIENRVIIKTKQGGLTFIDYTLSESVNYQIGKLRVILNVTV